MEDPRFSCTFSDLVTIMTGMSNPAWTKRNDARIFSVLENQNSCAYFLQHCN